MDRFPFRRPPRHDSFMRWLGSMLPHTLGTVVPSSPFGDGQPITVKNCHCYTAILPTTAKAGGIDLGDGEVPAGVIHARVGFPAQVAGGGVYSHFEIGKVADKVSSEE